jgi:NTE family protein
MKKNNLPLSHLTFSLLIFLSSCVCPQHYQPNDSPPSLPDCYIPEKICLALVLGGGGARGLAHIGVLEEFEKAEIPIDLIIGCSAGSLVGAMYADCPNSAYVRSILEPMKTNAFLDINLWKARYGLSQGNAMDRVLKKNLHAKTFDELQIPLLIVATDLYSGHLVTIGGGEIAPAVQASCAIPFVYAPVELHGRVFVDGGVIDPVPVRVAHQVNAEFVIAVDLRSLLPHTFPHHLFGVATRSAEITLLWQSESCLEKADLIIRPQLGDLGTFCDDFHDVIYEAGREAARQAIPLIRERLAQMSTNKISWNDHD